MNWRAASSDLVAGVSPVLDFKTAWLKRWNGASLAERSEMLDVVGEMLRGCGLLTADDLSRITKQGYEGLTSGEKELFVKKMQELSSV